MEGQAQVSTERLECIHCGGSHPSGMRRCTSTGRVIGGDPRLIGQVIARRFRVVRLLGEGPFGAAYKAEHVTLGREVSLRILPRELVSHAAALNRFFREARLVGAVAHPRLHPLLDAGLSDEGLAYVAYRYVRGRSLARAFALDERFSVKTAATIVREVLEGLEAIHNAGFVHRAIIPESILLQAGASGQEHAMLTNFGAATFEEGEGGPLAPAPLPSPLRRGVYMPPERVRFLPPDRREDIYGTGVILAAMLSPGGVPRFGGDLLSLGVPPTIEAAIARATHPSPEVRFSSAAEMAQQVRPFGQVVQDDPASATETCILDLRSLRIRERALQATPARFRLESAKATIRSGLAGALARALQDRSAARWSEVVRRVPAVVELLAAKANQGSALAMPLIAALEEADALCGTDDRLFCMIVGEVAGQAELNPLFQELVGGAPTPEFLFDGLAAAWPKAVGQGNSRARQVGRGYGRFEVRDQLEPSFALCSALAGVLKAGLEHVGARNVNVSKSSCEAVGDPACVYSVTWDS
jgi:serine/threonine-protein kinase